MSRLASVWLPMAALGLALGWGCRDKTTTSNAGDAPRADPKPKPKPKPTRGILGQRAPTWSLTTWFNLPENAAPPDVEDYRGKVVFLFFFQSW